MCWVQPCSLSSRPHLFPVCYCAQYALFIVPCALLLYKCQLCTEQLCWGNWTGLSLYNSMMVISFISWLYQLNNYVKITGQWSVLIILWLYFLCFWTPIMNLFEKLFLFEKCLRHFGFWSTPHFGKCPNKSKLFTPDGFPKWPFVKDDFTKLWRLKGQSYGFQP